MDTKTLFLSLAFNLITIGLPIFSAVYMAIWMHNRGEKKLDKILNEIRSKNSVDLGRTHVQEAN